MRTELFDFELPPANIALRPASPRDSARMLVVQPEGVLRDRVRFSIDCAADRITGDLETSGLHDGPIAGRLLSARVTLERTGAVVAMRGGGARVTAAPVDGRIT